MPSKRHAIAEHIRQRDLSQTRHDFAHQSVADGQELIKTKVMIGDSTGALAWDGEKMVPHHGSSDWGTIKARCEMDMRDLETSPLPTWLKGAPKQPPRWTPTDYAIFLLSALSVIGMGAGIWLWLGPTIQSWFLR